MTSCLKVLGPTSTRDGQSSQCAVLTQSSGQRIARTRIHLESLTGSIQIHYASLCPLSGTPARSHARHAIRCPAACPFQTPSVIRSARFNSCDGGRPSVLLSRLGVFPPPAAVHPPGCGPVWLTVSRLANPGSLPKAAVFCLPDKPLAFRVLAADCNIFCAWFQVSTHQELCKRSAAFGLL